MAPLPETNIENRPSNPKRKPDRLPSTNFQGPFCLLVSGRLCVLGTLCLNLDLARSGIQKVPTTFLPVLSSNMDKWELRTGLGRTVFNDF